MMSDVTETEVQLKEIFQCARCGYCCHGETTVSLDDHDQQRMIEELGLSRDEVSKRYWRITGKVVQMQIVDGHCIFYNNDTGCTVHKGRPWRCGQWPLHPSMLDDENNYKTISESCPGINKDLSYEEFRDKLRILLERERKLIC
jgi:Fe-S-cluster containining protein